MQLGPVKSLGTHPHASCSRRKHQRAQRTLRAASGSFSIVSFTLLTAGSISSASSLQHKKECAHGMCRLTSRVPPRAMSHRMAGASADCATPEPGVFYDARTQPDRGQVVMCFVLSNQRALESPRFIFQSDGHPKVTHQTSPSRSLGTRCRRTALRREAGKRSASGPSRLASSCAWSTHTEASTKRPEVKSCSLIRSKVGRGNAEIHRHL